MVKWSRRRPLTAESGVRLPYGLPREKPKRLCFGFFVFEEGSRTEKFDPAEAGEFQYGTYYTFAGKAKEEQM